MERRGRLLRDHRAGIAFGISEDVPPRAAPEWLLTRLHELETLVVSLYHLINDETAEAVGRPGNGAASNTFYGSPRKLATDSALRSSGHNGSGERVCENHSPNRRRKCPTS